ncbi:hypothetical protein COO60DRAFT_1490306 [Scenedesmus sp. NREL 46B-D3]|nr:hypothetical protein COO60DRAFT_1490306 [Scenedesmus sp. NREL 46B-D3]
MSLRSVLFIRHMSQRTVLCAMHQALAYAVCFIQHVHRARALSAFKGPFICQIDLHCSCAIHLCNAPCSYSFSGGSTSCNSS